MIEIAGVLIAHLFYSPSQCRLFYSNGYYWYLMGVAVCSMIASIPVEQLYNPETVGNGLALFQVNFNIMLWFLHTSRPDPPRAWCHNPSESALWEYFYMIPLLRLSRSILIFWKHSHFLYNFLFTVYQALRLPRAIRLFPPLKTFVFKILGGGLKLLVVFLIVAVFLVWFAVVSMQIFGYLDSEPECGIFDIDESFGNFFYVRVVVFCMHDFYVCLHSSFRLCSPYSR